MGVQAEPSGAGPKASFLTTDPEIIILEQAGLLRVERGHGNGADPGILHYVEFDRTLGGLVATGRADDLEPFYDEDLDRKVPPDDLAAAEAYEIVGKKVRLYRKKK